MEGNKSNKQTHLSEFSEDIDMITLLDKLASANCSDPLKRYLNLSNYANQSFGFDSSTKRNIGADIFLIVTYTLLVLIAAFGNTLVCHVIFSKRRMRTVTNLFIANLAVADILLICLNVPFNIARNMMDEWPFGGFLCHMVNFSLSVSMYASTLTLTVIALDRHRVLLYPLRPRMTKTVGLIVVCIIWVVAIGLSLPFGIYSRVKNLELFVSVVKRCRSDYPSPKFEQYLTVITLIIQYILPLAIITITYGRIVRRLWVRTNLGAVTENQQACRSKHKKKSIKMLMLVVIVFAICWMPLNLYQLLTKLHPDEKTFRYNSTAFFVCHWIAISSTCYNPFIYCWLNEAFRAEIRAVFRCCVSGKTIHPRDHHMTESLSQSEFSTLNIRAKGIFLQRGKTVMESMVLDTDQGGCRESDDLLTNGTIASQASGVCLTPDSWKSVRAAMEESQGMLDEYKDVKLNGNGYVVRDDNTENDV